tara:strand:+ start:2232 stop:3332 length:1101 start_codon:yes stop_codon:yes gene_type:complete
MIILDRIIQEKPELKDKFEYLMNCNDNEFINFVLLTMPEANSLEDTKRLNIEGKQKESTQNMYSAFDLYNLSITEVPKLLDPFFQKVGVAGLVGTSDSGKSTFLRQLSLEIALKQDTFLGFKLNSTHNRVIYVSTEDDTHSVGFAITKQINQIKEDNKQVDLKLLKNLNFIFDSENLLKTLEKRIKKKPVDLVVIDAFADVFNKEINANTQVRQFLRGYDLLSKKYNFLMIFLHHTGKRTQGKTPSKDNIIGSQAFEAKMRSVIELKPQNSKLSSKRDLWVLKANFLKQEFKDKCYVLEFGDNLLFSNTGNRGATTNNKLNDSELLNKIKELKLQGLSLRKISSKLQEIGFDVSKTTVDKILKDNP